MSSKKRPVDAVPRGEAASLADAYRRLTFALASAAKRLSAVDAAVKARRVTVSPAAVADLEQARRLVAGLGTPAVSGPKVRSEGSEG